MVKCGHIYTFDANLRYPTDNMMMSILELSKRYENVREFRDLSFPDRRIDNEELSNLAKISYCFIFSLGFHVGHTRYESKESIR